MWGYTPHANINILNIHASLTSHLCSLKWKRVDLWNDDISVHEWEFDGKSYAFDVSFQDGKYVLTLVSRDRSAVNNVRNGLFVENVKFREGTNGSGRFWIESFKINQIDNVSKEIAKTIRNVRRSVELTGHESFSYSDESSDLKINYSIKPERKNNDYLIFIFSSIRSKNHWIDFDGPFGESLKTIQARIIFITDDAASAYAYNFSLNSNLDLMIANVRFIKDYVNSNNYDWSKVTLAGLSKGATSAIMIGSQLPSCTVIALAPQLMLGNYLLRSNRNEIITEMSGVSGKLGAEKIDCLMWETLETASVKWGISNFYILTSEGDQDCIEGMRRLTDLVKQTTSNHLEVYIDKTEFTSTHLKTVHHLMPSFLVLLGAVTSAVKNFKF